MLTTRSLYRHNPNEFASLLILQYQGLFWLRNIMRKLLIQPKLMRFASYLVNFNEIFGNKMSKSLTILPENNPCIILGQWIAHG